MKPKLPNSFHIFEVTKLDKGCSKTISKREYALQRCLSVHFCKKGIFDGLTSRTKMLGGAVLPELGAHAVRKLEDVPGPMFLGVAEPAFEVRRMASLATARRRCVIAKQDMRHLAINCLGRDAGDQIVDRLMRISCLEFPRD